MTPNLKADRERAVPGCGTVCTWLLVAHGCCNGDGAPQGCTQTGNKGDVARTPSSQTSHPPAGTMDILDAQKQLQAGQSWWVKTS